MKDYNHKDVGRVVEFLGIDPKSVTSFWRPGVKMRIEWCDTGPSCYGCISYKGNSCSNIITQFCFISNYVESDLINLNKGKSDPLVNAIG